MNNSVEKEIDLNKIINEMYQKFGEELTELEKARYLYIELGKLLRYNLNYLTYYKRKKEDIYFETVNFDDIQTNAQTCVQMSDIYVEILKRVGIQATTQKDINSKTDYNMPHKYTVVNLSDGRTIIADLVYDLPFIQLDMKTENFGTNSENGAKVILSEDEIKSLDDRIDYTCEISENERVYTETFLEMIKNELNDPQIMQEYVRDIYDGEEYKAENLIIYKFDLIKHFFGLQTMGFFEGSKFLAELYKGFFSDEEREKISFYLLKREPWENHVVGDVEEIACYCYKKAENDCEYFVYEEGKGLENIDRESLKQKVKKYDRVKREDARKVEYGEDIFYE